MSLLYWCLAAVFLGTPILLSKFWSTNNTNLPYSGNEIVFIKWDSDGTCPGCMIRKISDFGKPMVLTHTPFDSWETSKWTPSFLRDKRIPFILTKQGKQNVFKYYASDQPLTAVSVPTTGEAFREVIMPGQQFFERMMANPDQFYYYANGDLKLLRMENLYTNISLSEVTFPSGNGQINFWFSTANVTAYTHYDTSENLHVTVYGRKKFLLFPPSAYTQLRLYPCLHQLYRQVQVDVLQLPCSVNPIEVILLPGQVLYIPPYWFHCVISMEPSISLNVWSDSESYLIMEEVYHAPLPFEESWGKVKLMKVLQYYIRLLASSTVEQGLVEFIRETVYSRYENTVRAESTAGGKHFHADEQFCLKDPPEYILDQSSLNHIHNQSIQTVKLLLKILPLAVRRINLGNYIEHLAWRILGNEDIAQLLIFLKHCFN